MFMNWDNSYNSNFPELEQFSPEEISVMTWRDWVGLIFIKVPRGRVASASADTMGRDKVDPRWSFPQAIKDE